jgi:hypothetical protein
MRNIALRILVIFYMQILCLYYFVYETKLYNIYTMQ